ncbi:MAG: chemotaxis protein CheA, partial [Lachnospiraceae bacterium]|nr:chemotaxis protein CheA [Lachnospiraceae bacterium]
NGTIKVKANMIDILFKCLDAIEEYVGNIQSTADEGTNDNEALIKMLNDILNGKDGEADAAEAPAQQEAAGEGAVSTEKKAADVPADAPWLKIPLGDSERLVIGEALTQGKHVYGINVKIQETCILKAARAFLVFKAIEELGEVIISSPSTQDIEDEKFDFDFNVIVITDAELEQLLSAAKFVSEIEDATGAVLDLDRVTDSEEAEATEEAAQKAAEPAPAEAAQPAEKAREAAVAVAAPQPAKPSAPEHAPAPAPASKEKKPPAKPVVNRTVRVDIEKLDSLMNLVSELITAKNSLVSAASNSPTGKDAAVNEQIQYLESVTTDLHESVMKVRMVPIENVVQKFPRMIRDLQKTLGKKMELTMTGEETELDRTVVDEIGDPLMHLLRNAADHGLEPTNEERVAAGKPEVGQIRLDAYQDGNNVIIEVSDDGRGINVEAVKNKAIERGVITPEQGDSMTDKEIINLLFNAGFSTAKQVTDISGRGVGLDVVKSKIESLSGEVDVKSEYGSGSTWSIRLPLTLAIIQALMVVVGQDKYAIALGSITTIEDIPVEDVKLVENKEVMNMRGEVIPLIRLRDVLDTEEDPSGETDHLVVIICRKGDQQAGFIVDELIGQQEIVIKSLGKYINKSDVISGATILGDGEVALIIDTNALM